MIPCPRQDYDYNHPAGLISRPEVSDINTSQINQLLWLQSFWCLFQDQKCETFKAQKSIAPSNCYQLFLRASAYLETKTRCACSRCFLSLQVILRLHTSTFLLLSWSTGCNGDRRRRKRRARAALWSGARDSRERDLTEDTVVSVLSKKTMHVCFIHASETRVRVGCDDSGVPWWSSLSFLKDLKVFSTQTLHQNSLQQIIVTKTL